ncbi:RNA polymerase sigma-70 factor [Flavivirga aquimarina]|uniref:RNA polymerase sigma-70 factor n=1 Tax=Flavivirga aquimarina TaxID=2027862 RepID=A0ABT8W8Y7_9FLAO|nr:RNA polymerase sigma-70 factor [Flavivirga aquimarina]MDO5969602.1 RNA polymerase sigma-70 factor [Flavivirga aquimarina]
MRKVDTYQLSVSAYRNIFHKLYKSLCLFANKYVENLEVSKDIVQDVFIKVWENKIEFKNKNNVKSFLYTSVKNKSLDYLKSKHYKSTDHFSSIKMEQIETESFFMREVVVLETSFIIEKAINTLPKKCAQIIRLSSKNFTNAEIAKKMDISINTVKAQKKIAYKRLKPILKEYFVFIAFIFN